MNAIELARQAYAPTNAPFKSHRSVEAQVIGNVTARLRVASNRRDRDFPKFAEALNDNRKLWNTLAIDVAASENELPPSLRAQIFYLAKFTEIFSAKILRKNTAADALIEINTSVMRGLNMGQSK
ncbi:flagellar protein FlaF [Loktanella ponticola]|uniref:Flagellar protein FlaF n=1 Tax=Yoonia ponticola TaxID=1524255 RepID=A0A7W9BKU3_9RHOB|nr:flagellar protein FlaF [Yoonia ponticola]